MRRPIIVVTVAATLLLLAVYVIALGCTGAFLLIRHTRHDNIPDSWFRVSVLVVVGACIIAGAASLFRRRVWARRVGIGILILLAAVYARGGYNAGRLNDRRANMIGCYAASGVFALQALVLWFNRRSKQYFGLAHPVDFSALD